VESGEPVVDFWARKAAEKKVVNPGEQYSIAAIHPGAESLKPSAEV